MNDGIKGRTVLITGASRNMGRAAALVFARASAKMKELNQVADEARSLGVRIVAEECDVADSTAVSDFVKKSHDAFGRRIMTRM